MNRWVWICIAAIYWLVFSTLWVWTDIPEVELVAISVVVLCSAFIAAELRNVSGWR